jgi:phenylpropionate dioxygenase-like ring-hydroxylating dioxygenase large terminal subunit
MEEVCGKCMGEVEAKGLGRPVAREGGVEGDDKVVMGQWGVQAVSARRSSACQFYVLKNSILELVHTGTVHHQIAHFSPRAPRQEHDWTRRQTGEKKNELLFFEGCDFVI